MPATRRIVKDRLREATDDLTASERQVATVLMRDYPMAGLQSITKLAELAAVSTPTVIRMARKLGYEGFPDMQSALRAEVADQIKKPTLKPDARPMDGAGGHILHRYASAIAENIGGTLDRLDINVFDAVAGILADETRPLYFVGGRITRSNSDYFFNHLQIVRPNVTTLSQTPNVWPQYLLDMDERSVLIMFDIRRYERDLQKLAGLAKDRGVTVILFTDQWGSPISKIADYCFNALVEAPSNWDSTLSLMLIVESLIADVQAKRFDDSRDRIENLEAMFSTTKLFRSFN